MPVLKLGKERRENGLLKLSKKRKRFYTGLLLAVALGVVVCLVSFFEFFQTARLHAGDLLYRGSSSGQPADGDGKIVIVGIDDASLAELGRFTDWPRSRHAELINVLSRQGARVIAFDILFSEPSPDDAELAAAVEKAGNVILATAATDAAGQEMLRPLDALTLGSLGIGQAYVFPDEDGVVRQIPLLMPFEDGYEPSLALATVAGFLRRPQLYDGAPSPDLVMMAGREIPLTEYGMFVNYAEAPLSRVPVISYADVLKENFPPGVLNDRIVLVGMTALGFGDVYWTPMGEALSGVEIHALAMDTILNERFIKSVPALATYLSIMLFAVLSGLAALRFRVAWSAAAVIFLGGVYLLAAFSGFSRGLLFDMFWPPLSLGASFAAVNLFNVSAERAEKREIAGVFGKYVSPSVAARILNTVNEGSLELGGEEYPVTIFFADARDFTGFCEKHTPREAVGSLNRYLSVIIEAVLKHEGMVNKFGGDSIMAVWNVPLACPEHPLAAVRAAVQAQEEIAALHLLEPDLARLEFGIGVNTGRALAGNTGSRNRLEYTVIGDAVNTASRLASAAPGGRVWISGETYGRVKNKFSAVPLKPLTLKGKGGAVQAYEISCDGLEDPRLPVHSGKLAV